MKRQAQYHGEIGANGRSYKKGQFIAEQKDNSSATYHKGSGKQEISPYVWEVAEEGQKSIYQTINPYILKDGTLNLTAIEFMGENAKMMSCLLSRYNQGEKWFYPNQEIYL